MIVMTESELLTQMVQSADSTDHEGLHVDLQIALASTSSENLPSQSQFEQWAKIAYDSVKDIKALPNDNEVTLRLVDADEMQELNESYRGKPKPTNVLSFPFEVPEGVGVALLGDIVICHQVVITEAESQSKTVYQHYAHMVTHGILHLCGYDHEESTEADEMEALEVKILAKSDLPNPYIV